MKRYERKTDLSLTELTAIIEGKVPILSCDECHLLRTWDNIPKGDPIPLCLACDEVGALFIEGNKDAEKILAKAMGNSQLSARAFFFLSYKVNELEPETKKLLKIYEQDPQNGLILLLVREKLETAKSETDIC